MPTQVSDKTILALYLALSAARKATNKILISNDVLKYYFFGNKPGRRLSEQRISKWAENLRPVIPRHQVKRSQYGPYLVLYLNEKPDPSLKAKPARLIIPNRATINKALGIEA